VGVCCASGPGPRAPGGGASSRRAERKGQPGRRAARPRRAANARGRAAVVARRRARARARPPGRGRRRPMDGGWASLRRALLLSRACVARTEVHLR